MCKPQQPGLYSFSQGAHGKDLGPLPSTSLESREVQLAVLGTW